MKKEIHINWSLVTGLLIFCINIWWIWDNLDLLYRYHYTSVLWLVMFPDWVLLTNAILGVMGFFIGFKVIKQKIRIKTAILTDFIILISVALLKMIAVM